jgi:hypothetical protein
VVVAAVDLHRAEPLLELAVQAVAEMAWTLREERAIRARPILAAAQVAVVVEMAPAQQAAPASLSSRSTSHENLSTHGH